MLDLRLDLFKLRHRLDALVLDLDHVPAELGLYRLGNLALFQLESGVGKFRHHLLLAEIAEIAAIGLARGILGDFLGDLLKILALLQAHDDRLDLVLGFLARLLVARRGADQDVAGMHFHLLAHLFDGFVIDLVHRVVGERFLADRLQQRLHQQLVAGKGDLALEVGGVAHFFGFGRLRHQYHVGHELHQVVLLGVRRHRRDLAGLFLGDRKVALVEFGAVDRGDQRVLVLCAERAGGCQ